MSYDELQGILTKIHIPCSANSVLYDAQYRINILCDKTQGVIHYKRNKQLRKEKKEKYKRLRRCAISEKSGEKHNTALFISADMYSLSAKENTSPGDESPGLSGSKTCIPINNYSLIAY
jgi:N-acetylmuramoyl-L-alanine amidase CwlA